jgi:hypothetical protein
VTRQELGSRGWGLTVAVAIAVAAIADAQPATRRATNLAALLAYPGFFHARPILIVGKVGLDKDELRLSDDTTSIHLLFKGTAPDGLDEVRGEFWDLGRMKVDDPRVARIDLKRVLGVDPEGAWPRAGEVIAIMASSVTRTSVPVAPSIRSIVLNPARYLNQRVTVTGQFTGRNLMGDLPDAPARSRWDFVIRSADAALWVSGARPKGKGFDLALDARLDTGRWLEITGVVHEGRGLQWLDVASEGIQLGKAPTDSTPAEEPVQVRVPAAPPPEVVFSAPTQEETDVALNASVRIQFSRDIKMSTLKGNVRVSYVESESVDKGEPTTPTADFTTQYNAASRVLEMKFAKPLERFRTLKVELKDGILGTDDQPLKPWTLSFVLGAS